MAAGHAGRDVAYPPPLRHHAEGAPLRQPPGLLKLTNLTNFLHSASCYTCPFHHNFQTHSSDNIKYLSRLVEENCIEVINNNISEIKKNSRSSTTADAKKSQNRFESSAPVNQFQDAISENVSGALGNRPTETRKEYHSPPPVSKMPSEIQEISSCNNQSDKVKIEIDEIIEVDNQEMSRSLLLYGPEQLGLLEPVPTLGSSSQDDMTFVVAENTEGKSDPNCYLPGSSICSLEEKTDSETETEEPSVENARLSDCISSPGGTVFTIEDTKEIDKIIENCKNYFLNLSKKDRSDSESSVVCPAACSEEQSTRQHEVVLKESSEEQSTRQHEVVLKESSEAFDKESTLLTIPTKLTEDGLIDEEFLRFDMLEKTFNDLYMRKDNVPTEASHIDSALLKLVENSFVPEISPLNKDLALSDFSQLLTESERICMREDARLKGSRSISPDASFRSKLSLENTDCSPNPPSEPYPNTNFPFSHNSGCEKLEPVVSDVESTFAQTRDPSFQDQLVPLSRTESSDDPLLTLHKDTAVVSSCLSAIESEEGESPSLASSSVIRTAHESSQSNNTNLICNIETDLHWPLPDHVPEKNVCYKNAEFVPSESSPKKHRGRKKRPKPDAKQMVSQLLNSSSDHTEVSAPVNNISCSNNNEQNAEKNTNSSPQGSQLRKRKRFPQLSKTDAPLDSGSQGPSESREKASKLLRTQSSFSDADKMAVLCEELYEESEDEDISFEVLQSPRKTKPRTPVFRKARAPFVAEGKTSESPTSKRTTKSKKEPMKLPDLDQILQEVIEADERKKHVLQMELSRKSETPTFSESPVTADLMAAIAQVDLPEAPDSGDNNESPMLQILDPKKGFKYFDPRTVESLWPNVVHKPSSSSRGKSSKLTYSRFLNLLERGMLDKIHKYSSSSDTITLQRFLWRLMSVHASPGLVAQCQATLLKFLAQSSHKYVPSIEDLFGILINAGVVSTSTSCCPLPHLYEKSQKQLLNECNPSILAPVSRHAHRLSSSEPSGRKMNVLGNLEKIIRTVSSVISSCRHPELSDVYMSHLALVCLWLACDKQILSKAKGALIKCLKVTLQRISSEGWTERLTYLTREVVSLGKSPKRVHHLTDLLLQIPRGLELKEAVSLCALHTFRGEEYDHQLPISPERVLSFLKSQDLHKMKDTGLLYELLLLAEKSMQMVPFFKQQTGDDLVKFYETLSTSIKKDVLYSEGHRATCHLLLLMRSKVEKSCTEPQQSGFIFKSSRQSCL